MEKQWNSDRLYFGGLQNHGDGDCSHEIKRHLLLQRKVMTNLDSILKSRDITLLTKVHIVKTIVFPVVMYGCESWTIKKAESQRIDAFELRCWRRLLRVPWIARRSNQPILKEINPEYSLEGLMLKLKLQYFGHLTWRSGPLEKQLKANISHGPHGLQHTSLPCPSLSPWVCSNSSPLNQWCHPTISSSVIPLSSSSQSFPASVSFPMSQLFESDAQSIRASASASALLMNIQGWFPVRLTSLIS